MEALEYDNVPKHIQNILNSYDPMKDKYSECKRLQKELRIEGYTCDYGLDGEIYDLRRAEGE